MSDIQTYNINNPTKLKMSAASQDGSASAQFKTEAYSSTNMKVERPKVASNDLNFVLPQKKLFSDIEATKKMQSINTDIYESAKKEKEKHEFDSKRYFTIFGILALLTAVAAYFRKGR